MYIVVPRTSLTIRQQTMAIAKKMSWLSSKVRSIAPSISVSSSAAPLLPSSPAQPHSASEFNLLLESTTQLKTMSRISHHEFSNFEAQTTWPTAPNRLQKGSIKCERNMQAAGQALQNVVAWSDSDTGAQTGPSVFVKARPFVISKGSAAILIGHIPSSDCKNRFQAQGCCCDCISRFSSSPHRSSLPGSSADPNSLILSSCLSSPPVLVQEKIIDPAFLLSGRFLVESTSSPYGDDKLVALSLSQSKAAAKITALSPSA